MKILLFTENLRAGGKERRIIELLKHLSKRGDFQFELVLTKNIIHYEEIHSLNIPIHILERKYTKKDPTLFFKFFRIAQKFKPDIIHVWGHMVAVYAVPTKLLLGVPMLNNEIVNSMPEKNILGKGIVFKYSDRIIANSFAGLKAYDAPMEKSKVIYNGFGFDRLATLEDPSIVRARYGITTTYVVGMVASFLIFKDYDTYTQAAASILENRKDITFLCIGDGDDSHYRSKIDQQNRKNILFLGRQSHVESIINICDLGVLTTNTNHASEGISNALIEFMALGKPVIATNSGGTAELIEELETGFLTEAFNPFELADKINYLINDNAAWERMGGNAKKRIENQFSIEAMIQSFEIEYKNLLSKR